MQIKNERLTFKVLPIHKAALETLANIEGESMAVVMRRLIKEEAQNKGIWPEPDWQPETETTE